MVNGGGGNPECWTCGHFASRDGGKYCKLHLVLLPAEAGPYQICNAWVDSAGDNGRIKWWREQFLIDAGVLYKYDLYNPEPPRPFIRFIDLPSLIK